MGDQNNTGSDNTRQPQQQSDNAAQPAPNQQNRQGDANRDRGDKDGQRIDTDGDGRTRDPNDTSPTDNGGRDQSGQ